MKAGDRVVINDYSDAQGDHGRIDHIQANGIILVELDEGCIWPVDGEHELILEGEAGK